MYCIFNRDLNGDRVYVVGMCSVFIRWQKDIPWWMERQTAIAMDELLCKHNIQPFLKSDGEPDAYGIRCDN